MLSLETEPYIINIAKLLEQSDTQQNYNKEKGNEETITW